MSRSELFKPEYASKWAKYDLKAANKLLDEVGLNKKNAQGYRLLPDAWGRGFATEGARALLNHGFQTLGLYRIIGLTHPDNAASQRVLQKAGLRDAGWGRYYERNLRVFVAERS